MLWTKRHVKHRKPYLPVPKRRKLTSQELFYFSEKEEHLLDFHSLNCKGHSIEESQKLLPKSLSVAILAHFDSHTELWREDCLKRNPHAIVAGLYCSIHGRVCMSI